MVPLHLAADDGLLGVQVALDAGPRRDQDLAPRADGALHPALHLHHALGVEVAGDGQVVRHDRERHLVASPAGADAHRPRACRPRRSPSPLLLDQRERVDRRAAMPDLEVQVRGARAARVAREPDDLPGLDGAPLGGHDAREVSVQRLVVVRMLTSTKRPNTGSSPASATVPPPEARTDAARRDGDVDPLVLAIDAAGIGRRRASCSSARRAARTRGIEGPVG